MSKINKDFGAKIKKIRLIKGLSQEDLSFRSKLHRTYVSDIERGVRNISLDNIEKLAKGLGTRVKDLFD